MHLDDMALFVEVASAMSFRRAAEALGIPNSTVSRRIGALEKNIGLRLLHRTTRRLELTEAGRLYLERARPLVQEAQLIHDQLGGILARPRGTLRASLPVDFSTHYLTPLVADFAGLYPDIDFTFDLTPRNADLVAEPFDVAIRMGPQPDSRLIARRLATLRFRLFASPAYLRRAGEPGAPEALADHDCIDFPRVARWTLSRGDEEREIPVRGRFRLNGRGMIRQLAARGLGVVMLPEGFVAGEIVAGTLCPVLPEWQGPAVTVHAMTETRLLPARTQLFIDFLRDRLQDD